MESFWPTCSNNATYPDTHIDISQGSFLDSAGETTIEIPATITKNVTSLWGSGTNGGSLDIRSIGVGHYWLHAISNVDTGAVDILTSLSLYHPFMPAGFTKRRLLFGFGFNGTSVIPFYNFGEWHQFRTRINSVLNVANNNTPVLRPLAVPVGAKMSVSAVIEAKASGGASAGYVTIRDPDLGGYVPSTQSASWLYQAGQVANVPVALTTDNLGRVSCGDTNNGDGALSISVNGWRLDRSIYR